MTTFTVADVEAATIPWLFAVGLHTVLGPDITPGPPGAERADYCLR